MTFQKKENPLSAILPTVRVRPGELSIVRNAATAAGMSVSEYIRSRVLADSAPIVRQSVTNPASSASVLPLIESLPARSSPLAFTESNLMGSLPASEQKKTAGRISVSSKECAHGFKRIGGMIACSECRGK